MLAMPGTDVTRFDETGATTGDATAETGGLVVRPFRALRYDPARVSDLAAVTSPPYDVIDPDSATRLEALDPHNIVRLILPRQQPEADVNRYAQARAALEDWTAQGILRRDEAASFYVYEQTGAGVVQRGLIAAVELRDPAAGVILPHEDVMPGPVADRLELMRATEANLEPILLVYDGGGATARLIDEVCAGAPLLETTTDGGLTQRLWAVTDPGTQQEIAADLAPRPALIADGHHRYATYRRLQAEHRVAGDGAGDWDLGLAMLVDGQSYPLRVQAIHRVVAGLELTEALDLVRPAFRVTPAAPDLPGALAELDAAEGSHPFVITDGKDFALIDQPDPAAVEAALPEAAHTAAWRSLDASLLHALLLQVLWDVEDTSDRVAYLHDAESAIRAAIRANGVAILMRPVATDVVASLAALGERMPRKSTSFGPKPQTGLVLRLLGR